MTGAATETAATILVVDDTPANLRLAAGLLEKFGFNVAVAQDGREALKRAQLIQPDLILLDVMMPDMDGIETVRRLKFMESTKDIPVIFMTALDAERDKVVGFLAGGVDYITKPFQVAELMARVDHQLALRASQRELAAKYQRLQLDVKALEETEAALRRTCRELEASEEGYLALIAQLPVAVLVHGEGKILFANSVALALLGGQAEADLIGTETLARVPMALRPDFELHVKQALISGRAILSLTQQMIGLDGRALVVEMSGAPICHRGTPAIVFMMHDTMRQNS